MDAKKAKKTVVATGIGNAMEWFDFGAYAYTTAYIETTIISGRECRHSTNVDFRSISHYVY